MPEILENLLLALGGYLFHVLKMWYEATKRGEVFINKSFLISIPMNIVAIILLIFLGKNLPPDLLVMSPFTCVLIGFFGSSMLAGFINVKAPPSVVPEDKKTTIP